MRALLEVGRNTRRAGALSLIAAAAVLSGCESTPGETGTEDAAPTIEQQGTLPVAATRLLASNGDPVTITLEDAFFDPAYVTAPPGTQLEVRVRNLAGREHNFSMENTPISVDLQPDEERILTVDVPSSGFQIFFCRFHTTAGMNGQLLPTGSQPIPVQGSPRAIP